ncbi:MAG: hypothetical protein ACOC22_04635 [bacterium]
MKRIKLMNENPSMIRYAPKNFKVQEFVDRETFDKRGKRALSVIDWRMLWTADAIREYFDKPIIINNWHLGGDREWSGIRFENSPYYSRFSQHSFGRALDFVIPEMSAYDVRMTIINNPNEKAFQYITALEHYDTMSWIHIDCRILIDNQERFFVFKP